MFPYIIFSILFCFNNKEYYIMIVHNSTGSNSRLTTPENISNCSSPIQSSRLNNRSPSPRSTSARLSPTPSTTSHSHSERSHTPLQHSQNASEPPNMTLNLPASNASSVCGGDDFDSRRRSRRRLMRKAFDAAHRRVDACLADGDKECSRVRWSGCSTLCALIVDHDINENSDKDEGEDTRREYSKQGLGEIHVSNAGYL